MPKKILKTERVEQAREPTASMFHRWGGSGGLEEAPPVPPRYPQHDAPICTLESTYRPRPRPRPLDIANARRFVSDSDIFMHQEADWYRPPKPVTYESCEIYPAPSEETITRRYSARHDATVESITRVHTPGKILVRFKTFLGMDGGSTQRVEVIADDVEYVRRDPVAPDGSGNLRMNTLFGRKASKIATEVTENNDVRPSLAERFDRMKNAFKLKNRREGGADYPATRGPAASDSADRIIRVRTLFGSRGAANSTYEAAATVDDSATARQDRVNRFKTLFKKNSSTQTEPVSPASPDAEFQANTPETTLARLKRILRIDEEQPKVEANVDDRHVFSRQSRQSYVPPRIEEQPAVPRQSELPACFGNAMKRMRATFSGARVNDIEISEPQPAGAETVEMNPVPDIRRRKFGSTSGWRWRRGEARTRKQAWCSLPKLWARGVEIPGEPTPVNQVIALICGVLVVVLMALGLGSADWLMAAGWRQGLFAHCIEPNAPTPLPFNLVEQPGCYRSRDVAYIQAAAGLCIVTLLADMVGALLTALGLRAADHRTKYKYYRLAVLAMALALISILIALVIYPVCFAAELNLGNRTVWEFGWAYGVGWGAAIFLFGAVVLLLCDKESEEIYYKERKVQREPPGGA